MTNPNLALQKVKVIYNLKCIINITVKPSSKNYISLFSFLEMWDWGISDEILFLLFSAIFVALFVHANFVVKNEKVYEKPGWKTLTNSALEIALQQVVP